MAKRKRTKPTVAQGVLEGTYTTQAGTGPPPRRKRPPKFAKKSDDEDVSRIPKPGSAKNHKPKPSLFCRVNNKSEAFCWMVRSTVRAKEWKKLPRILADWWRQVRGVTPLPEGSVHAIDVYYLLYYELLAQGHESEGVDLPTKVSTNLKAARLLLEDRPRAIRLFTTSSSRLFEYEATSEFGLLRINFHSLTSEKESTMAAKKRNLSDTAKKMEKGKKATTKKAAAKKEAPAKKKTAAKKEAPAKKKAAAKGEGGLSCHGFVRELLLKRKHTDEQMAKAVAKKFPQRTEVRCYRAIYAMRDALNAGKYPNEFDGKKKIAELE